MSSATARVIAYPSTQSEIQQTRHDAEPANADDFLLHLAQGTISMERLLAEQQRICDEIAALRAENRWQAIVDLFYPVEEKLPELHASKLTLPIQRDIAFCLGQLARFDEAIAVYRICLHETPEDFLVHSGLAYTLYDSLFAGKNRQIVLHPAERRQRIEDAHAHFQKAQQLRPDGVTNYYREGALYKLIQNKKEKAIPLFETAIRNWERLGEAERQARHQERKNYVKALYQLASCLLEENRPHHALTRLEQCLAADESTGYLSSVHKHFALGKVLFRLGRRKEALQALECAAHQARPEDDDYVFELMARVHLAEKALDKAWAAIERVPPNRRRPYFRWTEADVLVARGERERARKVLEQAAERDRKGRHKALVRLMRLDFQTGDYAQCLVWADQAETFFRQTYGNPCADALFWKAAALLRLGKVAEARQTIQELEDFRPGYPFLPRLRELLPEAGRR